MAKIVSTSLQSIIEYKGSGHSVTSLQSLIEMGPVGEYTTSLIVLVEMEFNTNITDYRVGIGHNVASEALERLDPQPSVKGIKVTRRIVSHNRKVQDEFLYAELEYNVLGNWTMYRSILDQMGILDNLQQDITITLKGKDLSWSRYNGVAVKPEHGEDTDHSNYFPRNLKILVKELEQL